MNSPDLKPVVEVNVSLPVKDFDGTELDGSHTVTVQQVSGLLNEIKTLKDLKSVQKSYKKQASQIKALDVKRLITSALSTMDGDAVISDGDKIEAYRILLKVNNDDIVSLSIKERGLIMSYALKAFNPLLCGRLDEALS